MGIRGRGRGNDEEACGLTTLSVMGGIGLRGRFRAALKDMGWGDGDGGILAPWRGREEKVCFICPLCSWSPGL
jgi:hypothetical protein